MSSPGPRPPAASPAALAEELVELTVAQMEAAVGNYAPGFHLPGTYGGHFVGSDVRADVAFTLGLLWDCGVRTVAGLPVEEAILAVLGGLDGPRTHTFFSYRVAETLARFGPFDGNPLLDGLDGETRANLAAACDSSSYLPAFRSRQLPRNYAAVLARCELARRRLGLDADDAVIDELLDATRALLTSGAPGHLDDSQTGIARYDIYTADVHLFCEPFADDLGEAWEQGARAALDLVTRVAATDGTAFAWGRSTGALGVCLTIEMGALALHRGLGDGSRWLTLAANAARRFRPWIRGGVITAHQHRSPYDYRGPFRRLQMTFDCLGKLADSARGLRTSDPVDPAPWDDVFGERDELVWLDHDRHAGVWSYRSRDLAFVLPLTGCTVADYLPAPRNPGLFEGPVGGDLPVAVPFAIRRGRRHVAAGLPAAVEHAPGRLRLRYEGWPRAGQFEAEADAPDLAGAREVEFRVEGRTLVAEERWRFPEAPDALAVQVAEVEHRPLRTSFAAQASSTREATVDTAGMKEWRSFWHELPVVRQLDIVPSTEVRLTWSVGPKLRVAVASTAHGHHYHRAVYDPLASRVHEGRLPMSRLEDPEELARWDIFHLHWPEWFLGSDVGRHRSVIEALQGSGLRIVWTQHNLEPHSKDGRLAEIYAMWAHAADGLIHHSHWGRIEAEARYPYRPDAVHTVVPHPHFGHLIEGSGPAQRADVERELGLRPGVLRLGVVGAPRSEKRIDVVVDAVARCRRDDIELLVLSLGPDEKVPDDPRIRALPYEFVDRTLYDRRLACIDVLVLPFDAGMLTTGTVGDVVGHGLPALASRWPFLREALGDAAIIYGDSADDLAATIEGLTSDRLEAAAAASRRLRAACAPEAVAEQTLALLEQVGTSRL